ncbi:polysaccharide biosynthesis protein [Caballeronia temeraria]|uniref:Polysaccharide biosynthesis protein n=1 Tax=Caballeronia temeraria TaxID=1777137 RepID=A0A158CJ23_9BURK|nr:polysaccharide biosynthesis/export family protein [Caballeronia temeraria]SAK81517.1 polysaccharide biosynthesis protein [Caballeronia temeraria]
MFRVIAVGVLSSVAVSAFAARSDSLAGTNVALQSVYGQSASAATASSPADGFSRGIGNAAPNTMTDGPIGGPNAAMNVRPLFDDPRATSGDPALPDNATPVLTLTQRQDYAANAASDVFGAQLFTGAFSRGKSVTFNGDYAISVGDRIRLRMWGGYDFDAVLTVDSQGSIFLPHAGPLRVVGVSNRDLQAAVTSALRRVFSSRVSIYVDLQAAQPVRVYVAGFVRHPGMYDGTSSDTLLRYLDQAGGIDPDRGSFLDVQVKRGSLVRGTFNLYDFLLRGDLGAPPLADGDVIFVGPRHSTVSVTGLASSARRFEFAGVSTTLAQIASAAKPDAAATHVRVTRNAGTMVNVDYFPLADGASVSLHNGDQIEFTADKQPGTITVRVEGEHRGQQEYVLPYGTRLGALLSQVQMTERSASDDVQLFRMSVKQRQKQLLDSELQHLEAAVLTARSGTEEEARLRKDEAALALQWVDRARTIQPTGQTVIGKGDVRDALLLENGDVLRVPAKDGLVLVGGEVLFPNTIAANDRYSVDDYIAQAGGFSQDADGSRVIVAHLDGTFTDARRDKTIKPGDQIMVLPKVDFKTRQFVKDIAQIVYQIAISAKVALGL